MGETFNDRLAVIDTDQARAHSAIHSPEYAKCAQCGESIELFVDLRNEFPDSHLYWAHVGLIPNHVVSVHYGLLGLLHELIEGYYKSDVSCGGWHCQFCDDTSEIGHDPACLITRAGALFAAEKET